MFKETCKVSFVVVEVVKAMEIIKKVRPTTIYLPVKQTLLIISIQVIIAKILISNITK